MEKETTRTITVQDIKDHLVTTDDVMLTETIPGATLSYKEKLRLTKTIPVDLSKEKIDERGYTYIDKGEKTMAYDTDRKV